MGLILNIETSSPVCSVCLAKDGKVVAYKESQEKNSHARLVTVLIEILLKENGIGFSELDAIAVSSGPGSYTGLRIGVSVAKGFCYAVNKPLIAVPTLVAVAERIKQVTNSAEGFYMPVLDAGRMDVYAAVYDKDGNEILKTACPTIDSELEKIIAAIGKVYVGGNAVDKFRGIFSSPGIHLLDTLDCDSRWMALVSEARYNRSEFEDLAYFEPLYLKEFIPKHPQSRPVQN